MKIKITLLLLLIYPVIVPSSLVYEQIGQHYLKNFTLKKDVDNGIDKDDNGKLTFSLPQITEFEENSALLGLFSGYEQEQSTSVPLTTLNPSSPRDLNLYFYDESRPEYNLLSTLYRGTTHTLGKIALAHQLATPTNDQSVLLQRQQLVQWLLNNPVKATQLSRLFKDFQHHEKLLLSLWNKNDLLYTDTVKDQFYSGSFKKWQNAGGKNRLEIRRRLNDAQIVLFPAAIMLYNYGMYKMNNSLDRTMSIHKAHQEQVSAGRRNKNQQFTTEEKKQLEDKFDTEKSFLTFVKKHPISAVFTLALSGYATYSTIRQIIGQIKNRKALAQHLRIRLKSLTAFHELVCKLHRFIDKEPDLRSLLPVFTSLDQYVAGKAPAHRQFLENLESQSFKGDAYFLTNIGAVLHALPQFIELRHSFAPLLNAAGSIDASIGLSKVYRAYQEEPVSFSFAEYVTSNTPRIEIEQFWHPLLDTQKVVTNSLKMGLPEHKDIILSGPNASGKSMTLKALSLCILLGQTIGFSPAVRCQFTPFSKITTYLNITDNLGENQSLFKAEVVRAQELISSAKALPSDHFAFTVMDEIFSSTAPIEGEAAAYGVAYALAHQPNTISLLATHFAKLTTLPRVTDGIFKNYKVYVNRRDDGTFEHPFRLEPGRSHQVIALDLMRQEGFDAHILAYADQFLANHPVAGLNDVRSLNPHLFENQANR